MAKKEEAWYFFKMRHSWDTAFLDLENEEAGRLIKAIFLFEQTGRIEKPAGNERYAYSIIIKELMKDLQEEDDLSKKRRDAANARWNSASANEPDAVQTDASDANAQFAVQTDANDAIKDNISKEKLKQEKKDIYAENFADDLDMISEKGKKETGTKPKKRFVPPTHEEVAEYCAERKNGIDAQTFIDYYEARDWFLKKGQKMADWKAAVRTWENNNKNKPVFPRMINSVADVEKIPHRNIFAEMVKEDMERMEDAQ